MYAKPLVPDDFEVPQRLETERLRIRPLVLQDTAKDYDAIMTSAERLQTVYNPGSRWPEGYLLEQDLVHIGWHQTEFENRTSFAYAVVALDESQVLGSLYIYPTRKQGYDCKVTMWVRQSEAESGLDGHLYETVREWVARDWPFAAPGYPGRQLSRAEWDRLPEDP